MITLNMYCKCNNRGLQYSLENFILYLRYVLKIILLYKYSLVIHTYIYTPVSPNRGCIRLVYFKNNI